MTQRRRKADPVGAAGREHRFFPADPETTRTLSADEVAHFNREGFISPLDVFDESESADLRRYIDNLLKEVLEAEDGRNSYSINTYHLVCERLWDLITEPRIVDRVTDLLGEEVVCWGSHLFAKMPHDNKTVSFHQDAIYWPLTPSKTVTVWLAIDDADAENAAMQFVPGSHLAGPLEHQDRGLDGTRVLGSEAQGMEAYPERFLNTLKAGQMSLHADLLLHGSEANGSDRRRAGMTMRFAAASVRLLEGYEDWRKTAVHVAGGDPEGYWYNRRRPEGEHPEKMADLWGGFDGQPLEAS